MTRDDVIRIASEAGMNATVGKTNGGKYHPNVSAIAKSIPVEWLERFAALVAADEREGCALSAVIHNQYPIDCEFDRGYDLARKDCAEAIRARGAA